MAKKPNLFSWLNSESNKLLRQAIEDSEEVKIASLLETEEEELEEYHPQITTKNDETSKQRETIKTAGNDPNFIENGSGFIREDVQGRNIDRSKEAISADYETHGSTADSLNRQKLKCRKKVAGLVDKNGTTIELFTGMGNLTNAVYLPIAKKCIMVEMNPKYVAFLKNKFPEDQIEVFNMNNEEFVANHLENINQEDVTLIDFDAFGATAKLITSFFKKFKVTRKIGVCITDGIGARMCFYSRDKTKSADELIRLGYPVVERKGMSISTFGHHLLGRLMERIASTYNLKLTVVSKQHNRSMTVYTGYILEPQ